MNEGSKLMVAAALVALGLGLAYLCGPPVDAPEIVHDMGDSSAARQLSPFGIAATLTPLQLHADAPTQDAIAGVVVLSNAEAEVPVQAPDEAEPVWQPPAAARENQELVPPRRVEMHDDAEPLSTIAPTTTRNDTTGDDWLLKPPVIPHGFDGSAETGFMASSASELRAGERRGETASAWWTRDTPRLGGLSTSAPTVQQRQTPSPNPSPADGGGGFVADANAPRAAPPAQPPNSAPAAPPLPSRGTERQTHEKFVAVEPMRMHVIVDGDTLARLAERYLGDPSRVPEILALNRDTLTNPELLPIGKPLRIPGGEDRTELAAEPVADGSTSRLVPVAAAPSAAERRPQARLQAPAPIAASGR